MTTLARRLGFATAIFLAGAAGVVRLLAGIDRACVGRRPEVVRGGGPLLDRGR